MSTLANVGFFFATTVLLKINEMSSVCAELKKSSRRVCHDSGENKVEEC